MDKIYSKKTIEDLRFLTFPLNGNVFIEKGSKRYELYGDKLEEEKITLQDIMTVRDIFELSKTEFNETLEKFFINMFELKNKGSLTSEIENNLNNNIFDEYKYYDIKDYPKNTVPALWFEKGNNNFAGFQKYVKSAALIVKILQERIEKNKKEYDNFNIKDVQDAIENINNYIPENRRPINEQKVAIATSVLNKAFSVISGGPGTGKTTVVFSVLLTLFKLEDIKPEEVCLLAPTGRAADRLKSQVENQYSKSMELCSDAPNFRLISASTIHKFLKHTDLKEKKMQNKKYKLIVVDESSMVDVYLMASLLSKISDDTRIILVGDQNQLPSVDVGCVLKNLENCEVNTSLINKVADKIKEVLGNDIFSKTEEKEVVSVPKAFVSKLMFNHRTDEKVVTLRNSFKAIERMKNDEKTEIFGKDKISDFIYNKSFDVSGSYILKMKKDNKYLVTEYLNFAYFEKDNDLGNLSHIDYVKKMSERLDFNNENLNDNKTEINKVFNHLNKYKVLTAMRKGEMGCDTLNRKFSLLYEKKIGKENVSPKILDDWKKIMNGMPIMVTRNDYKNGIFNGDIGIVLKDKNCDFKVIFKVKNEFKAYAVSDFEYFEIAFSTTIHKSQGSEYQNVFIPIEPGELEAGIPKNGLLTNELIYTAVTRAKKCFIIFSEKEYLKTLCKNPILRVNHIDLIRS